jgi:hypothetical protein
MRQQVYIQQHFRRGNAAAKLIDAGMTPRNLARGSGAEPGSV